MVATAARRLWPTAWVTDSGPVHLVEFEQRPVRPSTIALPHKLLMETRARLFLSEREFRRKETVAHLARESWPTSRRSPAHIAIRSSCYRRQSCRLEKRLRLRSKGISHSWTGRHHECRAAHRGVRNLCSIQGDSNTRPMM